MLYKQEEGSGFINTQIDCEHWLNSHLPGQFYCLGSLEPRVDSTKMLYKNKVKQTWLSGFAVTSPDRTSTGAHSKYSGKCLN